MEPSGYEPVKISVIVPARDEEDNIENLLQSILRQTYTTEMFEVIVVDDHSTDNTAAIVNKYADDRIRLVQLKDENLNSFKKKAIETGIEEASGELIVTTDADCIVPENWLKTIAAFYRQQNAVFIAAPVVFENDNTILQLFQTMEFMALQGITGASINKNFHSMSNGANLAYERKTFYEAGGFSGIDHIASGDDMLLMHKIWKRHPGKVKYLKSKQAIVKTKPAQSWKEFFNQRIRWASKINHYQDKRITTVLAVVYFFNLSFLVLLIAGFWNHQYWLFLIVLLILKTLVEYPFINSMAGFFEKRSALKHFFLFQPLHIFYIIIAGLLGLTGKYTWKNRRVR